MNQLELPDTWIWSKLGDITDIIGGGTPERDNSSYFQGDIPWATPTDITKLNNLWIEKTSETITRRGLENSSANYLPVGTVLMTSRASIGDTAINTVPMATNQGFANFICNEKIIINEYLAYWLPAIKQKLIQLASGTTFKEISKSTLSKVEIPLPSPPEQRYIAAILREAEEIRKLRQHANEKMQGIVEALFYDMFGDPIKPDIGWRQEKLEDFVNITSSLVLPTQERYKEMWHIGSDNIESGTGRIFDMHTVAEVGAISNKFLFSEEHVLYSKIRPALRKVATPGFVGLCSADIYPLSYDAKRVSKLFLAQLLRSKSFTDYALHVSDRAQIPKINREDLLKYQTVLPDIDTQKNFEERVQILFAIQDLDEKFKVLTNLLHQSSSSQAFTGELTASWREQHVEELAQAARERDALLQRQVPDLISSPELLVLTNLKNEREDILELVDLLQQALLDIFARNSETYFTAHQLFEEHEEELQRKELYPSLDHVQREVRTLSELGLIKEMTLPVTDQPGYTDYLTVYRYQQSNERIMNEDLESLKIRGG